MNQNTKCPQPACDQPAPILHRPHDRDGIQAGDWRLALKTGDFVRYRDDEGILRATHIRSLPWQTYAGTWVIMLQNITGCYRLDRVEQLLAFGEQINQKTAAIRGKNTPEEGRP